MIIACTLVNHGKKFIYLINYYFNKSMRKVIYFINDFWMPHFSLVINHGILIIEFY